MRHLALAVGKAGRDAVGDQAQAANAEGGAPAEAARGNLQVLRVVLPVLHRDARHTVERLGEVDLRTREVDVVTLHAVDRRRHFHARALGARAGNGDGVRLRFCRQGKQKQRKRKNKPHHFSLEK